VRRQEDNMANNNNNAFPPLDTSMTGPNRNATSPTTSHPGSAANGNGAGPANYMATLPVGHQQDLNFLYNQIQELGALLRSNREQVESVTRTAEEVAVSSETICYRIAQWLTNSRLAQFVRQRMEQNCRSLTVSSMMTFRGTVANRSCRSQDARDRTRTSQSEAPHRSVQA
jgi:hypothetical protein